MGVISFFLSWITKFCGPAPFYCLLGDHVKYLQSKEYPEKDMALLFGILIWVILMIVIAIRGLDALRRLYVNFQFLECCKIYTILFISRN